MKKITIFLLLSVLSSSFAFAANHNSYIDTIYEKIESVSDKMPTISIPEPVKNGVNATTGVIGSGLSTINNYLTPWGRGWATYKHSENCVKNLYRYLSFFGKNPNIRNYYFKQALKEAGVGVFDAATTVALTYAYAKAGQRFLPSVPYASSFAATKYGSFIPKSSEWFTNNVESLANLTANKTGISWLIGLKSAQPEVKPTKVELETGPPKQPEVKPTPEQPKQSKPFSPCDAKDAKYSDCMAHYNPGNNPFNPQKSPESEVKQPEVKQPKVYTTEQQQESETRDDESNSQDYSDKKDYCLPYLTVNSLERLKKDYPFLQQCVKNGQQIDFNKFKAGYRLGNGLFLGDFEHKNIDVDFGSNYKVVDGAQRLSVKKYDIVDLHGKVWGYACQIVSGLSNCAAVMAKEICAKDPVKCAKFIPTWLFEADAFGKVSKTKLQ